MTTVICIFDGIGLIIEAYSDMPIGFGTLSEGITYYLRNSESLVLRGEERAVQLKPLSRLEHKPSEAKIISMHVYVRLQDIGAACAYKVPAPS